MYYFPILWRACLCLSRLDKEQLGRFALKDLGTWKVSGDHIHSINHQEIFCLASKNISTLKLRPICLLRCVWYQLQISRLESQNQFLSWFESLSGIALFSKMDACLLSQVCYLRSFILSVFICFELTYHIPFPCQIWQFHKYGESSACGAEGYNWQSTISLWIFIISYNSIPETLGMK